MIIMVIAVSKPTLMDVERSQAYLCSLDKKTLDIVYRSWLSPKMVLFKGWMPGCGVKKHKNSAADYRYG